MKEICLQDKKSNMNRQLSIHNLSKDITSSCEIKRKISTSTTKKRSQIEDTSYGIRQNSKYLIGWGKIPSFDNHNNDLQIVDKDILTYSIGEQHIVFINNIGQVYGIGNNKYGQLGNKNQINDKNVINKLCQEINVKKIFCTNYNTFIINQNNQVYGCGINNRGQLGVGFSKEKKISQSKEYQEIKSKSSRSKINSIFYQQQRKQHENYNQRHSSLLQQNQSIIDIQGGPFHTIILTSKGRIFYTGNLYNTKSLENDEFTTQFNELNISFLGKAIAIKSSITGICFLTLQNKLFLLGIFGKHIFNEPQMLDSKNIMQFDVNQEGVYIIDAFGDLLFYNVEKDKMKEEKIYTSMKIKGVYCGLDYVLIINKQGNIFGKGDNSQKQLCNSTINNYSTFHNLQLTLNQQQFNYIKCSNNFVISLASKIPSLQHKKQRSQSKNKDIERQNKILKELLCNKNKKNVKTQTQKESKFDIVKPINSRTFDNSLEIPFQEIKLGKQISEGGYGIIYKATWRKSVVAVKIFKIEKQNQNAIRDFVSQCHAMQALRHPNIVMFLGACTKPPHFAIVLEYCQGGTLWTLLQKTNFEISWQQRRNFALDIAKGMNYLHERTIPIIHRDLKSLNLLLDANKRIKLADFGWTKGLQNYMTGKIGTYQWMAPQVISAYQYTQKADIFSFAIILWEIAARQAPYRNIPGPQVAQDVLLKDLRPIIPKKTPQQFVHLIQRCWNKDPSTRPSFNSIISILQDMTFH